MAKSLAVGLLALIALAGSELLAVQRSGAAGERGVARAQTLLREGRLVEARRTIESARGRFAHARRRAGVVAGVTGLLPAGGGVADQARAARTLSSAGTLACDGLLQLVEAASEVARTPARSNSTLAKLRRVRRAVAFADEVLERAGVRLASLRDRPLVGPLGDRAAKARRAVHRARARLASGHQALVAMIALAGGEGPRRYLVLAQNPAEPRPTGGFIGSYGVLTARGGAVRLERYASIESWYRAHPRAVVAAARAPRALTLPSPPVPQTIANVNATADWPRAAMLAARLWRRGGEARVDGVISVTPDLVARALRVIGPVRVPGFARTVTGTNVIATLEEITHRSPEARTHHRKRVVSRLAHAIMERIEARSTRLPALAQSLVRGLDAGEALVWTRYAAEQRTIAARGWDGSLPRTRGDFFYDSEFSYPAKNGRELRRTFDHRVDLRADASAEITTTITIRNANKLGYPYRSYTTLYGPAGGRLVASSHPPIALETPIAGHPAAGWVLAADAWGTTTVRVVWEVPGLLVRRPDGRLVYRLTWKRVPLHSGDLLRLRVTPPAGWRWTHRGPPAVDHQRRDLHGAWSLTAT